VIVAPATFALSLAVAFVLFPILIRFLREQRAGQVIQEELPESHQRKAGTPTGGGVVFVLLGALGALVALGLQLPGSAAAFAALVLGGALGFADDMVKLREGWLGIPARFKFPVQLIVAIPVAWLATRGHGQLFIPGQLAWIEFPLAVLAIVGTANAVNLTDGMDGLAGSLTLIAIAGLVLLVPGTLPGERLVAAALFGSLVAFLFYNRHPAQVFMGDTGSLALGYALGAMAIQQGVMLLLPLLGLVFVIETLSVIIQVAYFKASGGRRVFKMTPIHYTFQLEGWSENRIALSFWGAGALAAAATAIVARSLA
jgi:phospho-N-acetylmuramoyl-pentapeptide-transferase